MYRVVSAFICALLGIAYAGEAAQEETGAATPRVARGRYAALAHPGDLKSINERLGPRTRPKAERPDWPEIKAVTVPMAPLLRLPFGHKPIYNFGTPKAEAGNYWCTQGQVLYVPDKRSDAGVDRITIGDYNHNTLQFTPTPSWWGGSHPEPGVLETSWGEVGKPFFVERAYSAYSGIGFMIFNNGLIGAGSVINIKHYPSFRFPPHKWPTSLALTNKNEFLLVTVWDAKRQQAQLAVLALGLRDKGKVGSCLPNWGVHNLIKLLGYVDIPGLELPSGIACTAASNPRIPAPQFVYELDYSTPQARARLAADPQIAGSGYAVIISKVGNQAAFIDLQPLFAGVQRHCFTTAEAAAKAQGFDLADGKWPYTFKHDPTMAPVPVTTIAIPAPTAVRTSMRAAHGRPAIAAIACEAGELRVFTVGGLLTTAPATPADVQPHVTIPIGYNPVAISHQRQGDRLRTTQGTGTGSWDSINYVFLIACRGDKEIDWVEITATGGECYRRFRDSRFIDPVHVQQMRTNSTNEGYVFTVCDFEGRKIINYRLGDVHVERKDIPVPGGGEIECTGFMAFPGFPFMVSSDNVP